MQSPQRVNADSFVSDRVNGKVGELQETKTEYPQLQLGSDCGRRRVVPSHFRRWRGCGGRRVGLRYLRLGGDCGRRRIGLLHLRLRGCNRRISSLTGLGLHRCSRIL